MKRFLVFLAIAIIVMPISSESVSIRELKKRHAQVKKQLKQTEKVLREISSEQKSILSELKRLNEELESYKARIRRLKNRMETLRSSIMKVDRKISALQRQLARQKGWLKKKLQSLQVNRTLSRQTETPSFEPLIALVSSEDISQAIRRWFYFRALARYDYEMMKDYLKNLEELKGQRNEKERLLQEYKKQKARLLKEEKALRAQRKQKTRFLASLQRKHQLYKQMVSELKQTERKIYRMIREEERKKSSIRGFRKMKRHLPWPVEGRIALPFGSYIDPKYKTRVFRNGVYIRAREDSPVRAVYEGEVVFADWIEGYGKVVILRHGEGYYTIYGGLSEINVKKADIVEEGEVIGRVGESGVLNEPALYFEVRFRGKPLNPIYWLSVRR